MNKLQIFLLATLTHFKTISAHRLNSMILSEAKRERKGKKKHEIIDLGLMLHTEEDAENMIENALNEGLLIVIDINEDGRKLQLTAEGKLAYVIHLTDNFSPAYKAYEMQFNQMVSDAKQLSLPRLSIMRYFHSGVDIKTAINNTFKKRTTNELAVAYHHHLIHEVAKIEPFSEEDFIFHLAPVLYVPHDLIGRKVTLEIEGFEKRMSLAVSTPFTNKRYYVAGIKKGRKNTASGFYPIIQPKETFPVFKDVLLRWTVDGEIRIDHKLEIDFSFKSSTGYLFSTVQSFSRSIASIDQFRIVTSIDQEMNQLMNNTFIVHDIYNHFEIRQNVALTNFPMDLHSSAFLSSPYYSDFYKQFLAAKTS